MVTIPPGMTPEKLEKIADYVSLLDRMDIDLDARPSASTLPAKGRTPARARCRTTCEPGPGTCGRRRRDVQGVREARLAVGSAVLVPVEVGQSRALPCPLRRYARRAHLVPTGGDKAMNVNVDAKGMTIPIGRKS